MLNLSTSFNATYEQNKSDFDLSEDLKCIVITIFDNAVVFKEISPNQIEAHGQDFILDEDVNLELITGRLDYTFVD